MNCYNTPTMATLPKRHKKGPAPRPLLERFFEKVNKNGTIPENRPELGPCWLWTASCYSNGYGRIYDGVDRVRIAHRVSYELFVGPLPEKKVIDHLCRVHNCVNPAHLEAVTNAVNLLRGEGPDAVRAMFRKKTHCKNGHRLTGDNVKTVAKDKYVSRVCGICRREARRRYRERQKQLSVESS